VLEDPDTVVLSCTAGFGGAEEAAAEGEAGSSTGTAA